MKINDNYEITVDERNFVLKKYIEAKEKTMKVSDAKDAPRVGTGEYTKGSWELIGYYPSLTAALRGYINVETRSVPMEVNEILRKIDEVMVVIENIKEVTDE